MHEDIGKELMRQMKDNAENFQHYMVITDFNEARDKLIAAKLPGFTAPTNVKKRPANVAKPKGKSKKPKGESKKPKGEKPDEPDAADEEEAEEEPEQEGDEEEDEDPGSSGENPESKAQTNNASSSSDDWKQRAKEDMKELPFEAWGNEKRF